MSYLALSPSGILSLIGFLLGGDKTIPTPADDYRKATIDLVIPAHNEEKNIVLCLESIARQTVKPTKILLVDDGSTDRTSEFARLFADYIGLNLTIIRREISEGKTPTVHHAAHESHADILFVLDADTMLRSNNYIERLVKELYQGVGIACACGVIEPEFERDRVAIINTPSVSHFARQFPEITLPKHVTWRRKFEQNITNNYRGELYLFLQNFIYRGEMVYFGTIINPVGCAVAYRRKYLLDVLDKYTKKFGFDLTSSEDIFIGFAFANLGYRNIQVHDVTAHTGEPIVSRLPRQIMLWSSSFLQSCYYFDQLLKTPFKLFRVIAKKIKDKRDPASQKNLEKRVIKEAYRQTFSSQVTEQFGRPIGWFIFTSLFEKISFPTVIVILIILNLWEMLLITMAVEITIYTFIIGLVYKKKRIRHCLKSLLYTFVRYFFLIYDFYVILNFAKDIWITKNRAWRK